MRKVRSSVRARISSVRRSSTSRRTGSKRHNLEVLQAQIKALENGERKFRGIAVQALLNFLQKLEKGQIAENIELYSFLQAYRVRDGLNIHLPKGTSALLKKEVGLAGKVQVYVPGVGEFLVDSKMLHFKDRQSWTTDDVAEFVFRHVDLGALNIPFTFQDEALGDKFQGSYVCHVGSTNFHDLVVALVDHCRSQGKNPFESYVYLDRVFMKSPPEIHGKGSRKSSSASNKSSSIRGSISRLSGDLSGTRTSLSNEKQAGRNTLLHPDTVEAIHNFEECLVYVRSWEEQMQVLKDLQCMCEVHEMATVAESKVDFAFEIFSPTEQYKRFINCLAEDLDGVVQQILAVDIRKAKPARAVQQQGLSQEQVNAIAKDHVPGGWDAMETRIFSLLQKWISSNIERMVELSKEDKLDSSLGGRSVPMVDLLSIHGRLLMESGRYKQAEKMLRDSLDMDPQDEVKRARTLNDLGVTLAQRALYQDALDFIQQGLMARRNTLGKDSPVVAQSMVNVAAVYSAMGDCNDSHQLSVSAMNVAKEHAMQDVGGASLTGMLVVANALHNIGSVLQLQGRIHDAIERFEQVLEIRREKLGHTHPSVADVLNSMACCYLNARLQKKGFNTARESLRIARSRDPQGDHPRVGMIMATIGHAHLLAGDLEAARRTLNRALSTLKTSLEGDLDHPSLSMVEFHLASLLEAEKRPSLALQGHQKALQKRLERLGEDHLLCAESYMRIGELQKVEGDLEEALESFRRAASIRKAKLGRASHLYVDSVLQVAELYDAKGLVDKADASYKACLVVFQKNGDQHSEALTLGKVCRLKLKQREYEEAVHAGELAVRLFKSSIGTSRNAFVADVLFMLAEALRCLGNFPAAIKRADESVAVFRETLDDKNDLRLARALRRGAVILKAQGNYEEAKARLEEALATQKHISTAESYELEVDALTDLATIEQLSGNYNKAIARLEAAQSVAQQHGLPMTRILFSLGLLYDESGNLDRSLEIFQDALEEFKATEAKASHESLLLRQRIAMGFYRLGEIKRASKMFEEAADLAERLWLDAPDEFSALYISILETQVEGFGYYLRADKQREIFEKMLRAKEKTFSTKSPRYVEAVLKHVRILLFIGDVDQARSRMKDAEHVLAELEEQYSESLYAERMILYAKMEELEGNLPEAMRKLDEALLFVKNLRGLNTAEAAPLLSETGKVLAQLGLLDQAKAKHQKAAKLWESMESSRESVDNLLELAKLHLCPLGLINAVAARDVLDVAMSILRRDFPPNHYLVTKGMILLASLEEINGRLVDALIHLDEALDTCKSFEMVSPLLVHAKREKGKVLFRQGNFEAASKLFNEAQDDQDSLPCVRADDAVELEILQAELEFELGNCDTAEGLFRVLAERDMPVERIFQSVRIHFGLGQVLKELGDVEESEEQFRLGLEVVDNMLSATLTDPSLFLRRWQAKLLFALGDVFHLSGKQSESQSAFSKLLSILDDCGDADEELGTLRGRVPDGMVRGERRQSVGLQVDNVSSRKSSRIIGKVFDVLTNLKPAE